MRELVPGFENLNSRGARVDGGGVYYFMPGTISHRELTRGWIDFDVFEGDNVGGT